MQTKQKSEEEYVIFHKLIDLLTLYSIDEIEKFVNFKCVSSNNGTGGLIS